MHAQAKRSNLFIRCVGLRQPLGCRHSEQSARAIAQSARYCNRETNLQDSLRFALLGPFAAHLQWASTGTKDPAASDVLYVNVLAAPLTVNTMSAGAVKALADHGEIGEMLSPDGCDCEELLSQFAKASVDIEALAATLQDEGAKSFIKSWNELMSVISAKTEVPK